MSKIFQILKNELCAAWRASKDRSSDQYTIDLLNPLEYKCKT